jgi:hypothetical protein
VGQTRPRLGLDLLRRHPMCDVCGAYLYYSIKYVVSASTHAMPPPAPASRCSCSSPALSRLRPHRLLEISHASGRTRYHGYTPACPLPVALPPPPRRALPPPQSSRRQSLPLPYPPRHARALPLHRRVRPPRLLHAMVGVPCPVSPPTSRSPSICHARRSAPHPTPRCLRARRRFCPPHLLAAPHFFSTKSRSQPRPSYPQSTSKSRRRGQCRCRGGGRAGSGGDALAGRTHGEGGGWEAHEEGWRHLKRAALRGLLLGEAQILACGHTLVLIARARQGPLVVSLRRGGLGVGLWATQVQREGPHTVVGRRRQGCRVRVLLLIL